MATDLHDHDRQVLEALSQLRAIEATSRLDTIMARLRSTAMTWPQATATLDRLLLIGWVRSITLGRWFITREGLDALQLTDRVREVRGD